MRRLALPLALAASAALAGDRDPAPYVVENGVAIPEPLAGPGDPGRGAAAAKDPERGACLDCHRPGGAAAPPDALAEGADPGRLRLALVNLAIRDPDAPPHAFYHVPETWEREGPPRTRLSAQEIEDVLAWLAAL